MNLIQKYNITENEVLKNINFLKRSDVIFAAAIPLKGISEYLDLEDFFIVEKNNESQIIVNKKFVLKDGDVIFCNTEFVSELFTILKTKQKLKKLTLITAQSDLKVTEKLYKKKPKSIEKWFCVNSSITKKDLHPIPFGIANISYNKNIIYEDFLNFKSGNVKKLNKIYGNFNLNTNYFHRFKAKKFLNDKRCNFEDVFDQKSYLKSLHLYKFVLCPWGNGLDTHRYWEAIYAGAIPITLTSPNYEKFLGLPGFLIDSYNKKNIESIFRLDTLKLDLKVEMLTVSWWFDNLIKPSSVNSYQHKEEIAFTKIQIENLKKRMLKNKKFMKIVKQFKTLIRKIHKKLVEVS